MGRAGVGCFSLPDFGYPVGFCGVRRRCTDEKSRTQRLKDSRNDKMRERRRKEKEGGKEESGISKKVSDERKAKKRKRKKKKWKRNVLFKLGGTRGGSLVLRFTRSIHLFLLSLVLEAMRITIHADEY